MKKSLLLFFLVALGVWVQAETQPSRKQLIATYYAIGDYNNAGQYLTALPQTNQELVQFKNYYDLLINVANDERNIYQLNREEISTLQGIAETNTSAALAAQGILTLVNGEIFGNEIERTDEEQLLTSIKNIIEQADRLIEKNISLYPNPANQSVIVGYDIAIEDNNTETTILLVDITGKQLFAKKINNTTGLIEIPTDAYSNGVYFIQLQNGATIKATRKLIINH
jgi:hypothetical protein